ncbi:hypothetical protein G5I_09656 [Acromyrmex echinatior]|uniref:Uncharacterized protein n=1 Tax=Acromyrmex echinatior TaxID=103372 RepID=F4WUS8_ACREC|nr:hypothetical protein G5I_09656 [Acromyrmex echinatior]
MPRCSNDAGVDNLTAFCGDQGMVNDYDGEDRQLRQAVGSRVERATRATLGNLLWDPLKDYLRRRVQSHLQKTIQPPIQVNRYLMNVCSKVQDFKEPALRKRQNKKNAKKNIRNDKKRECQVKWQLQKKEWEEEEDKRIKKIKKTEKIEGRNEREVKERKNKRNAQYIESHLTRRKTCDKSAQFVTPVTVRSHKFRKKILLPGRF